MKSNAQFGLLLDCQRRDHTSGIAGPRWGGEQLLTGRISLLNGATDSSKLLTGYILQNHVTKLLAIHISGILVLLVKLNFIRYC